MCNVFSGLVVAKHGRDWGKVLFDSGVHHEKDRAKHSKKYGDALLEWESKEPYSLSSGFKCTNGVAASEAEKKELLKLVDDWAKKQDKEKLLRSMVTVTKNNKPTEDYQIHDNMLLLKDGQSLICDFTTNIQAGYGSTAMQVSGSTAMQGDCSTATQGYGSTATQGDCSIATQGSGSTATQGSGSTATQGSGSTATQGDCSTATQGSGSTATQGDKSTATQGNGSTMITYGDTSYVILNGKNVLLTQIWHENGEYHRANVNVDDLFKKHKIGDKIKIVKGKEAP